MKRNFILPLTVVLLVISGFQPVRLFAQGTAFSYQGFLVDQNGPVNGTNDLTFTLFPTATLGPSIGTSNVINDLSITEGLLTVTLDFGPGTFNGDPRWLQIAVRPGASSGPYTNVNPRQRLTPAPYAIFAGTSSNLSGTLTSANLSGTYGSVLTLSNAANVIKGTFTGNFIGNGAGITNVAAATLNGLPATEFWQLEGNNVGFGQVLGSTNNQAVQIVVNGFPALRLEPNSMALPNVVGGNSTTVASDIYAAVIGGGFANNIDSGATESVIAGGSFNNIGSNSYSAMIAGGANNKIQSTSQYGIIVGGEFNVMETNSAYAFMGGGGQNSLKGNNAYSVLGGGNANALQIGANYSVLGGGVRNTNSATTSVIAGGENNTVQAGADRSFIAGGLLNSTTGPYGMIGGGFSNSAANFSFAAGRRARAVHVGAFVWTDSADVELASIVNNSMSFRASGGVRIFSNTAQTLGVSLAANGTSWAALCDRDAKKNFATVNCVEVLEKLAGISVQRWSYRWDDDNTVPNLGPMAQDFKAAFYPGRDDKTITTLEFDGVELAAIQGLNQKMESENAKLREELNRRDAENLELKRRLEVLEAIVLRK